MLLDPPKRALAAIETLDRDERDGKGRKREKDPNTSTSSGKPGGNNCASRRKKKVLKNTFHFYLIWLLHYNDMFPTINAKVFMESR